MERSSRESQPIAEMNVIPFIDICLVLLIIVLVTASYSTPLLVLNYPQAVKTQAVELSGALFVDVAADGACALAGKVVTDAEFAAELGRAGAPSYVAVRAAGSVQAQHVLAAVGQIRSAAGAPVKIAFVTREK